MAKKIYKDGQGRVLLSGGNAIEAPVTRNEWGYTGHVDAAGLAELGWNANDIAWLQKLCWWDEEDDDKWKVTQANKEFGPNGSTPITWANHASVQNKEDVVFFPKLATERNGTSIITTDYKWTVAVPTDGWPSINNPSKKMANLFELRSVGNIMSIPFLQNNFESFASYSKIMAIGDTPESYHPEIDIYTFRGYSLLDKLDLSNWKIKETSASLSRALELRSLKSAKLPTFNAAAATDLKIQCPLLSEVISCGTISYTPFDATECYSLTRQSCVVLFNALDENVQGTIKLYAIVKSKLLSEDIAIATAKGWTIA